MADDYEDDDIPTMTAAEYQQQYGAAPSQSPPQYRQQDQDEDVPTMTSAEYQRQYGASPQPIPIRDQDVPTMTSAEYAKQYGQPPQAEGMVSTAAREAAHGVLPFLASIPGAEAGAAAGGALGTAILPGIGTTVGAIGGGLIGAGLAAAGTSAAQETGAKMLGFDDAQQRAANAATNPGSALVGQLAPMAGGFGAGGASLVQRGLGAALGGGLEAGQELVSGDKFDPTRIAAGAATGAVFARPRGWTEGIQGRVRGALPESLRSNMPSTGGVAKESTPPATGPVGDVQNKATVGETGEREVGGENLNTVNYGKEATQRVAGATPGARGEQGVNVLQPGQGDPTVSAGLRSATEQATPPEARTATPPPEPPTQYGPRLDQEFPRVPEGYTPGPGPAERAPAAPPPAPAPEPARAPAAPGREPAAAAVEPAPTPAPAAERAPRLEPSVPPATPPAQSADLTPGQRAAAAVRRGGGSEQVAQQLEQQGLTRGKPGVRRPPRGERLKITPAERELGEGQTPTSPIPILERGLQRVEEGVPPGTPVPPEMQALQRRKQPPGPPLQPAMPSDLQTGLLSTLRRNFGALVGIESQSSKIGQTALKSAYGPLARLKEQTLNRFTNDMHQLGNRMDQPAFENFVDAYESGQAHTLPPDQQKLAGVLQKNNADFWDQVKKLPGTDQMQATENYLTHMYDNSNGQVSKFAQDWYGPNGGSLKARTHPTFADARAADLKPLSNNPIEHFVRYSEGMSNYLAQRGMAEDLKQQGRFAYFSPEAIGASGAPQAAVKGAPPEGWAEIKAPWAQQPGRRAYAPRDIAETLNQFYSAGLRNAQTKDIYQFLQQTKNTWSAVELGLSAYHLTTMAVESMASGMARSLQMAASGNYKGAVQQLVKAPAEPITSALLGKTGRQIYRDTTGTVGTPLQQRIIGLLSKANVQPGNLRITGEYDMTRWNNFWDAYKRGSLPKEFNAQLKEISDSYGLKLPKVLLDNVRRAVQTISKPIFEHYVPAVKLGSMMKDMEAWLHANPNATDAQALKYAEQVANSTDNRMGEMNYNNLFMNKAAKDASTLALRSFGFTVGGPIREIGAGAGAGIAKAVRGKNPLDLRSEAADPRTAYAMAFLPTIAAIGAAYQYLRTGKPPEDWRDLVTPQTGGTVKSVGQQVPERVLIPGYMKDFLGYFVNPAGPLEEVKAKLAAPWTAIGEQLTGKDWRDKDYVPPRATTLEWLQAHGRALGAHALPIGPKQLAEGRKPGSALSYPEQALGVRTPGAYMLNPKGLEKYMTKQRQQDWRASEKQLNRQRADRGLPPLPARRLPAQ